MRCAATPADPGPCAAAAEAAEKALEKAERAAEAKASEWDSAALLSYAMKKVCTDGRKENAVERQLFVEALAGILTPPEQAKAAATMLDRLCAAEKLQVQSLDQAPWSALKKAQLDGLLQVTTGRPCFAGSVADG